MQLLTQTTHVYTCIFLPADLARSQELQITSEPAGNTFQVGTILTLNCTFIPGLSTGDIANLTWNCPDDESFYCNASVTRDENSTTASFSSVVSTLNRTDGTRALVSADAGEAICTKMPTRSGLNESIEITLTG